MIFQQAYFSTHNEVTNMAGVRHRRFGVVERPAPKFNLNDSTEPERVGLRVIQSWIKKRSSIVWNSLSKKRHSKTEKCTYVDQKIGQMGLSPRHILTPQAADNSNDSRRKTAWIKSVHYCGYSKPLSKGKQHVCSVKQTTVKRTSNVGNSQPLHCTSLKPPNIVSSMSKFVVTTSNDPSVSRIATTDSSETLISKYTALHRPSTQPPLQRVQSKLKQFWLDKLVNARQRIRSIQNLNLESNNKHLAVPDLFPEHAHTITGCTVPYKDLASILQPLSISPQSNVKPEAISTVGLRNRKFQVSQTNNNSTTVNHSDGTMPVVSAEYSADFKPKSGRYYSIGDVGQMQSLDDFKLLNLPKPSKLPREYPISSLEFTTSRLKNSKKHFPLRNSLVVLKRKKISTSNAPTTNRDTMICPSQISSDSYDIRYLSRSEENLHYKSTESNAKTSNLDVFTSPSSNVNQEFAINQHYHRHGNHGHRRSRGCFTPHHANRVSHMMTRVVESKRYLMFTKSIPFWSAKHYLESQGSGLGESETYSVFMQHTSCYDLMPPSAKLIVLDSQLTISKAFKALIHHGLRAAPVWNSSKQTFGSMLTVTDFVLMLNFCWNPAKNMSEQLKNLKIDELDQYTIDKWKELTSIERSEFLSNQLSICQTPNPTYQEKDYSEFNKKKECSKITSTTSWPSCRPLSPTNSLFCSSPRSRSSSKSSTSSLPSKFTLLNNSKQFVDCMDKSECMSSESPISPTLTVGTNQIIVPSRLFTCSPEDNVFKALRMLCRYRLHHLPVLDSSELNSGNVLYILTQRKILNYLFDKMNGLPQPRFLQSSLNDLNVGTRRPIHVVTLSTKLIDALSLFREHYISALPVVDNTINRKLINLFSKYDVITLVLNGAYKNPDMTIKEVLTICKTKHFPLKTESMKPPVVTCLATNNLLFVMEKLTQTGFRRLIIVNNYDEYRVEGVVSLSDVLRFVILQQARPHTSRVHPPSVAELPDE